MLEIRKKQQGNSTELFLEGDAVIATAQVFFSEIKNAFISSTEIIIDFANVREIDTSAFQILALFKKEAAKQKKTVKIQNHAPELIAMIDTYGALAMFSDKIRLAGKERPKYNFAYGIKKLPYFITSENSK